jgi:uncharacterized damage-inducible protein DinB
MDARTLTQQFGLTSYVLERNIADLSHEETLISPRPGGNCLNWVVGHITRARNSALGMMTGKHPYPMEDFNAYDDRGGVPFSRQTALPLTELIGRFRSMQELLVSRINQLTPEALAQPAPFSPTGNPNETIGSLLVAFVFHESYHVGQTGLLRRLAGRPGAIKPTAEPVAVR